MSKTDELDKSWKPGIYKNYSSLFKTEVNKDSYTQFIPYANYIAKNYLPKDQRIFILDIGCGLGGFTWAISQAGYENIEGVDLSEESIRSAHAFGIDKVKQGDIFTYLESAHDESIDVVLCLDVLEHFTKEEGIRLLLEVKRVLKADGRIIIHVPNAEGIFGSKIRYADFTHETAFTPKSISQLLQFVGFGTVQCFEDKPIVHGLVSGVRRWLWSLVTLMFRFIHAVETGSFNVKLSQNILVVAFKEIPRL